MASMILRDGRAADVASVRRPDPATLLRTRPMHARVLRAQGYTVEGIAGYFGVDRRTVTRWLAQLPAAAEALALAVL